MNPNKSNSFQPQFLHIKGPDSTKNQPIPTVSEGKEFLFQMSSLEISPSTKSIRQSLQTRSQSNLWVLPYIWKVLDPSFHQLMTFLESHQQLLSIPYRNVKDMEKHIRIYLKKQYGIQKRYLIRMTQLSERVWAIELQKYCYSKINKNLHQAYPSSHHPITQPSTEPGQYSVYPRMFLLNNPIQYETEFQLSNCTKIKLSDIFFTLLNIYV